jgi:hypothetical protein
VLPLVIVDTHERGLEKRGVAVVPDGTVHHAAPPSPALGEWAGEASGPCPRLPSPGPPSWRMLPAPAGGADQRCRGIGAYHVKRAGQTDWLVQRLGSAASTGTSGATCASPRGRLFASDVTRMTPPTRSLRHRQAARTGPCWRRDHGRFLRCCDAAGRPDVAGLTGKGQAASERDRTAGALEGGTDGPRYANVARTRPLVGNACPVRPMMQ